MSGIGGDNDNRELLPEDELSLPTVFDLVSFLEGLVFLFFSLSVRLSDDFLEVDGNEGKNTKSESTKVTNYSK